LGGCDGDDEAPPSQESSWGPQLAYLEPGASLVAAIDARYGEENWERLEPLVSRGLRAARSDGLEAIPLNLEAALQQLSSFAGLDFEDDVRPVLDGHLVVGLTFPPREPLVADVAVIARLLRNAVYDPRRRAWVRPDPSTGRPTGPIVRKPDGSRLTQQDFARVNEAQVRQDRDPEMVAVYRTQDGDLGELVDKVVEGDRLERVPGHENARLITDGLAVVGDDTIVLTRSGRALEEALDRAASDEGFPLARLRAAERDVDLDDPLVLASGDVTLARALVEEPNFQRAIDTVPYLAAVRRLSAGVDVGEREAVARVRIDTGGASLAAEDLPLGPPGELALPETDAIAGASRDQSRTTTFAATVVRALFEDSRFVAAVERTERDLGSSFEEEVLRQFDCPSVSVFDDRGGEAPRFGARSCVRDPERMRELLPRLAPHLPRVLTAMQGLGEEGLLGLLLIAPDAPLTPSALTDIAQVMVRPFGGGDDAAPEERLYEVTGLAEPNAGLSIPGGGFVPGVERVVFGMIGDDFVVGSDREMAREAAALETEALDTHAASAVRVPAERAAALQGSDEARILDAVFTELVVTFAATPAATTADGRLGYER
jgi:hypothetical protein